MVLEAQRLHQAQACGQADLETQWAGFSPVLKGSLASDTQYLAAQAGVGEKAAFLALMNFFDN